MNTQKLIQNPKVYKVALIEPLTCKIDHRRGFASFDHVSIT